MDTEMQPEVRAWKFSPEGGMCLLLMPRLLLGLHQASTSQPAFSRSAGLAASLSLDDIAPGSFGTIDFSATDPADVDPFDLDVCTHPSPRPVLRRIP